MPDHRSSSDERVLRTLSQAANSDPYEFERELRDALEEVLADDEPERWREFLQINVDQQLEHHGAARADVVAALRLLEGRRSPLTLRVGQSEISIEFLDPIRLGLEIVNEDDRRVPLFVRTLSGDTRSGRDGAWHVRVRSTQGNFVRLPRRITAMQGGQLLYRRFESGQSNSFTVDVSDYVLLEPGEYDISMSFSQSRSIDEDLNPQGLVVSSKWVRVSVRRRRIAALESDAAREFNQVLMRALAASASVPEDLWPTRDMQDVTRSGWQAVPPLIHLLSETRADHEVDMILRLLFDITGHNSPSYYFGSRKVLSRGALVAEWLRISGFIEVECS